MTTRGIVILISGRGSNMQAILRAAQSGAIPAAIQAIISNKPDAEGLAIARTAGIPTQVVAHQGYASRIDFDRALIRAIDSYHPALVVLAGFMRLLTPEFIQRYENKLINIHPSLLPAFPGLDTHRRALQAGVKRHGATVHFVTAEMDTGPIIAQRSVPVLADDTPQTLAARVLQAEHVLYPEVIQWFLEGRLSLRDGQVLLDGAKRPVQGLETAPTGT